MLSASHPSWILSGLIADKPKSMRKELAVPVWVRHGSGNTEYFNSMEGADSQIVIDQCIRGAVRASGAEWAGIGSSLHLTSRGHTDGALFFPGAVMLPRFENGGRAAEQWYDTIAQHFAGKKLYFYRAQEGIHVYLNSLLEYSEYFHWEQCVLHGITQGIVNKAWWEQGEGGNNIYRWSSGGMWHPPAMYKWVLLQKEE